MDTHTAIQHAIDALIESNDSRLAIDARAVAAYRAGQWLELADKLDRLYSYGKHPGVQQTT